MDVTTVRLVLFAVAPLPYPGQPPAILVHVLREKSTICRIIMFVLFFALVVLFFVCRGGEDLKMSYEVLII